MGYVKSTRSRNLTCHIAISCASYSFCGCWHMSSRAQKRAHTDRCKTSDYLLRSRPLFYSTVNKRGLPQWQVVSGGAMAPTVCNTEGNTVWRSAAAAAAAAAAKWRRQCNPVETSCRYRLHFGEKLRYSHWCLEANAKVQFNYGNAQLINFGPIGKIRHDWKILTYIMTGSQRILSRGTPISQNLLSNNYFCC